MSYDQKCYELAEFFLNDVELPGGWHPAECEKEALAQQIQETIEDYIRFELKRPTEEKKA